jgi:hypothetical protein
MRIINNQSSIISAVVGVLAGSLLSGCSASDSQNGKYAYIRLADPYRRARLKVSTTLEALSLLDAPSARVDPNIAPVQLLTQSDTAAALSGKSADGAKVWVNVIAFDEHRLTARRKYFFFSDERPASAVDLQAAGSVPGALTFDAQFVIEPEVAAVLYATDEAKKTAILRSIAQAFAGDVRSLAGHTSATGQADASVALAGMMMTQVFQGVLVELDKSSALAKNLGAEQGIAFSHVSLGEGRVRLLVTDGIGTVAIRINQLMPPLPEQ